jgi:hypothetical protein
MNFILLTKKTKIAKNKISASGAIDLNSSIIISILQQLEFIIKYSEQGVDPRSQLKKGQTFTYSVLASREFCSPSELSLKNFLDEVSQEMYSDDYI